MVSTLASSAIDRGFVSRSIQTKDYEIDMYCVSNEHTSQRSRNKDWLVRNQNKVSEWSGMSTRRLFLQ